MKKCKTCRHYRIEKGSYAPKQYPCDTCIDEEMNFEAYSDGKTTTKPRNPFTEPSRGIIFNQKEYREMTKNFSKSLKQGKFIAS